MTRWILLLAAVPWALYACSASPSAADVASPSRAAVAISASAQQGMNVSQIYAETCAKCHGDKGQGGGGGTRTLLTDGKFDQTNDRPFFDAVKDGVPDMGMEGYGQTMRDEVIWGLVVHIREMQARYLRERDGSPQPVNGVYQSRHHKFKLETVIDQGKGLDTPWSIDWLPDGRMLVANRPGTLMLVKGQTLTPVEGVPEVRDNGQGGLLEVAVHPDYAKNGWIYLAYNDPGTGGGRTGMTKIVRGKLDAQSRWTSQKTIWEADPSDYSGSGVHFGSRIVFDGKGKLFFSIGERGAQDRAQDLARPNGKVYRINDDGSIPADNPFQGQGQLKSVWSYGHRNPQGLVLGLDGTLWSTEHGPRGGDELNVITKGANYGWPLVSFSINYNDSPFRTPWPSDDQKIAMPVYRWLPSIGACGLDVARGAAFPNWKGDLLAGGLSGQNLDRIRVVGGKMTEREELLHGLGRVRDVSVAKDGSVYVALNGPDMVVRLVPAP